MTIELLNIDCMGGKGRRHSEETRRRIGDANKGKLLGRKRDLESVKKGAETRRRGAYIDKEYYDAAVERFNRETAQIAMEL